MNIEEHQTVTEPVEKLEKVFLDDSNHERTTKIGTLTSPAICQELMAFLRSNRDVFSWTHEDMPRIDPSVIVHRLNVSPSFPPIRQKNECSPRNKTKPLQKRSVKASFIREVYYLDWPASKRGNGQKS